MSSPLSELRNKAIEHQECLPPDRTYGDVPMDYLKLQDAIANN